MSQDNGLQGRTALVTGGASGIGLATARALTGAGARVVVADVDEQGAQRVAGELGGTAWCVDLLDTAALAELSLETDVLVNNAGIQTVAPPRSSTPRGSIASSCSCSVRRR